jgi:enamine deaminase RidA (YjgF/YER057c/UK114 family)
MVLCFSVVMDRFFTTETLRTTEGHREIKMGFTFINPESLGAPRGYSNGVMTDGSRLLFIAGQIGWNEQQQIVSADIVDQFDRALANVIAVVADAGGKPEQIARFVIYVTDKSEYRDRMEEIGKRYRARMGKHFPAMVLVEVAGLLEDSAKIEIEGVAVLGA